MPLLLLSLRQLLPVSSFAAHQQAAAFSHLPRITNRQTSSTNFCASRKMTSNNNEQQQGLADIGDNNNSSSSNPDMKTWKERIDISIAKSRKVRGSNYVQISTIDYETMEPRCRTVVFRGFMKDLPFGAVEEVLLGDSAQEEDDSSLSSSGKYTDCVMKMITDLRSNKVSEVESFQTTGKKNGNTVEMVWWFPKSSEQYRIRGNLQFIGNGGPLTNTNDATSNHNDYFVGERKQQWGNLSDMAREQFYWDNPGIPYCSVKGHEQGVPPGGRDDEGKVLPVPDSFLLMLLYPTKIDYLKLGENYRQIDEWKWEGGESQWEQLRMNP
ncbi:pyridoxamine 5'-phosphate oxidase family protein [Skeletonema marinoi]|uniref:Pyridoxamine 5'-phosphate oxidase family protein n=1 Tax=Skeletonema marinoi TaxID=267567 RepID=A0AAD9DHP5_9STRA|nr:pyridoxamine 5'-phosphate oxidase family protein [Skeletonema marinoi]